VPASQQIMTTELQSLVRQSQRFSTSSRKADFFLTTRSGKSTTFKLTAAAAGALQLKHTGVQNSVPRLNTNSIEVATRCTARAGLPSNRLTLRYVSSTTSKKNTSSLNNSCGTIESDKSDTTDSKEKIMERQTVKKTYDISGNEITEDEEEEIDIPPELLTNLRTLIASNAAVLFMKGSPDEPLCGFSHKMVGLLDAYDFDNYTFVDVTKSDVVKEALKKLTYWPTVPQLFVKNEFVGGLDIVQSMHDDTELGPLLAKAKTAPQGVVPETKQSSEGSSSATAPST